MSNQRVYMSITKFVNTMKEKYSDATSAIIYFEGKDAFTNKYKRLNVKPVLIQIKDVFIKHENIISEYGNLIISSPKNNKVSDKYMYRLNIDFTLKTNHKIKYYQSNIIQCSNEEIVKKIRDQIIEDSNQFVDEEADYNLFPDAF